MLQSQSGVLISQDEDVNNEIIEHFTSIFKNQRPPDNSLSKYFIEGVRDALIKTTASKNSGRQGENCAASPHQNDEGSHPASGRPAQPLLTAPISVSEIKRALIGTKSNKSPGTDGIPYEFYIKFWDSIGIHFLEMFKHVLENGSVLPSQGKAAVRMIPKTPSPKTLAQYRPISLLNSDYNGVRLGSAPATNSNTHAGSAPKRRRPR